MYYDLNKSDQTKNHRNCDADMNNDLSNNEIIYFLRENEMTVIESDWLRSHGTVSEVEVLKLVGQIMLSRDDG
jgi:hypothetical protein